MLRLNTLDPLVKKRKRVGRGGSRGGYSGRGRGGQKTRPGSTSELSGAFEGGQMPLVRRLPCRGFTHAKNIDFELVNLKALDAAFEKGQSVGREQLIESGIIKGRRGTKVKLLGNGELTKSLTLLVDAVSVSAKEAVEKAGGTVSLVKS